MPAERPFWLQESWVPVLSGLVWIHSGADAGLIAALLAAVPGTLMLGSGAAQLLWAGDPRAGYFGAAGGVLGIALGIPSMLWAGFWGGLGLMALAAASFTAVGFHALRTQERTEEAPEPDRNLITALEAAGDSALLANMFMTAPPHALRRDGARVAAEVHEALDLFRDRGWVEKPIDYHVTPPELTDAEVDLRARTSRGVEFEHLRFESRYEPHPEEPGRERWLGYVPCRTGHAWVLRHAGAERPWLMCTHGYQMGSPLVDFGAFSPGWLHHKLGLNLLLPVLPIHGPRKLRRVSGEGFLAGDLLDTVHALAQTAWDLRRLHSWILLQGAPAVGAYGLSLGGYSTALFSSLTDDLGCAIAGIPVSDFARLTWLHGAQRELRSAEEQGVGFNEIADLKRVVSPLGIESRVPHERRYLIGGSADLLVPPDQVRDLWRHWDRPRIHWYSGGHITVTVHRAARKFTEDAIRESLLS